jgi:hypothetical protein
MLSPAKVVTVQHGATARVGIACGENSPPAQTFSAALNRHGLWPESTLLLNSCQKFSTALPADYARIRIAILIQYPDFSQDIPIFSTPLEPLNHLWLSGFHLEIF